MKKFVMRAVLVLAGGVILVAASPQLGHAQSEPDPQQIVTLTIESGNSIGPCGAGRLLIDAVIDPADGSLTPFVIPPRKVLVLTGGTWSAGPGLQQGSGTTLQVFLTTATTSNAIVLGPSVPASAAGGVSSGFAAGAFTLRPGIVIRPDASLCVNVRTDSTELALLTVRLYGFLAKDR